MPDVDRVEPARDGDYFFLLHRESIYHLHK
jgi:hypothetical protein